MGNSPSSGADHADGTDGTGGGGGEGRRNSLSLASRGLSHRIVGGGSNNNASHRNGLPHISLPSPFNTRGSLGLSKSELDERCKPSGLYPTCEWEPKQIRRLISNGQLAARLRGNDSRLSKTDRECPICFMYYSETNVSKCCSATLCTECYLQIKPGKDRYCICPFCNNPKMQISVAGGMDEGDVAKREEEEQRVIEATIRQRASQLNGESPGPSEGAEAGSGNEETASEGSFGSSLASYNRSRTFSNASNASSNPGADGAPRTPIRHSESADSDGSALLSLAMSPDDRRALESEMRAQLSHETHRRMESEAEEARLRHAQEWYGSQSGARARMREARLAELTGLLERMSVRSAGGSENNDGSREAGSSLMAGGGEGVGVGGGRGPHSLSRLLRAMENSSGSGGRGGSSLEDLMRLEAAFFLGMGGEDARALRSSRSRGTRIDGSDDEEGAADGLIMDPLGFRPRPPRSSRSSRRSTGSRSSGRGMSSTHLDTAELLMRGVSEEEQLAMAIAMSMQDAQQQGGNNDEGGGDASAADNQEEGEGAPSFNQVAGDDDDGDSSSESSSTSSSNSSRDDDNQNSQGGNNHAGAVDVDAVSLDDDEEEVIFAEV